MNLNKELGKKLNSLIGAEMGKSEDSGTFLQDMNNMVDKLEQTEQSIIKRKFKKSDIDKLVGNNKMKLPIGKLYSVGKTKTESISEITTKKDMMEKWSQKYKDSIDCNNPKGFSQKAHCQGKKKNLKETEILKGGKADKMTIEDIFKKHQKKYKNLTIDILKKQLSKGIKTELEHTDNRNKAKEIAMDHLLENPKYYDKLKKIESNEATASGAAGGGFIGKVAFDRNSEFVKRSFAETPQKGEFKEAASSASSGSYETPAAWAKSTSKKHWRGKSKTLFPGGKFVQVKKKCKKMPYCNQGDIKALKLTNEDKLNKMISELSKKHNISESLIKKMIYTEFRNKK